MPANGSDIDRALPAKVIRIIAQRPGVRPLADSSRRRLNANDSTDTISAAAASTNQRPLRCRSAPNERNRSRW